jgi:hypothetical protein
MKLAAEQTSEVLRVLNILQSVDSIDCSIGIINRLLCNGCLKIYSECCDISGYHWDCSDWVNRSQNPLPNITEVPGSEVPDSSSFHSNESNESNTHQGNMTLPPGKCQNFQQDTISYKYFSLMRLARSLNE